MLARMNNAHLSRYDEAEALVERLFGQTLHAKRLKSLANGAVGVLNAEALGIHAIGRGLAAARDLNDKHAVKQIDRLIGNPGIDPWALFADWVPFVLGDRKQVRINLDWTDFEPDGQTTLVASVQTNHGRSTPLGWLSVRLSELKEQRNNFEDRLLVRLREVIPRDVRVTIVADRGFGDHALAAFLSELGFGYIIRFRQCIYVTNAEGETRKAEDWLGPHGRMRVLRDAKVTAKRHPVPTVVCVRAKDMKEAWCLWASESNATGAELVKCYGKRFTIEESFRDVKDLHFGMGMSWTSIGTPARRDRMLFIAALALALLTLLGAAGEDLGFDRQLKTNTSPRRQLSLARQGARWLVLLPGLAIERSARLLERFGERIREHGHLQEILGAI